MRKQLFIAVLVMAGVLPRLHAQIAMITAPMLESQGFTQIAHMVTQIEQAIANAQNTYNQFQNLLRAEERARKNMLGVTDIKSFDDFKKWYNRQLYLEKEAETRLTTSGVKIGDKFYSLKNVQDIPEAAKNNFTDFFGEGGALQEDTARGQTRC
jgi:hypothetical protein